MFIPWEEFLNLSIENKISISFGVLTIFITVILTVVGIFYAKAGYLTAQKGVEIQNFQLKEPFFGYSIIQNLDNSQKIQISNSNDFVILKTLWYFPASTTFFSFSENGEIASTTPAGPGKIFEKFSGQLSFKEIYRAYEEEIRNAPQPTNNIYFGDIYPDSKKYLKCKVFPMMESTANYASSSVGVMVIAQNYYQRLDGSKDFKTDLLTIRGFLDNNLEIDVRYNISNKKNDFYSLLTKARENFFRAILNAPFDQNEEYAGEEGECSQSQHGYGILPI